MRDADKALSDDEPTCRQHALSLLARREHSRMELERKLAARHYSGEVIAEALNRLEDAQLIDHRRFAESFVRARSNKGQGPVRIKRDLGERGVDGIDASLAIKESGVDWGSLAANVRARKFGAEIPQDYSERARQSRFLQYRGFTLDQIQAALDLSDNSD